MAEYFDLYTRNKQKTGKTLLRGTAMDKDDYRYVVHVLVVNDKNELLIHQRHQNKDSYPNMWAFSASGSVIAGETSQQGASRELAEELGIIHDFSKDAPLMSYTKQNYFIDYYLLKKNVAIDTLVVQCQEVQDVKWVSQDDCLAMVNKGEFIPYVFIPYLWNFFDIDSIHL
ncbi:MULTISPECIES: NUDIX domain-containing protein [unclassified Granulicatella]|uniref:NUDIX hydrolase n=1 Tax=unclassified Granulicatella TaxID=2630493 RepID=UPI0014318664|nr:MULTISPECIES: NUDIX domain-containing protein [unclassified Granulicatella]MBF0780656.1 NUDIX domain-containing protein [Granulicatella sp. 19428wC4_WM01]